MSDSSQYSQGSQSSAPQQQLRRPASPTQDRPPHEIVRPRLEESATREAVRAADQLQPAEQPAEQPANERANAPVNEPARQGGQQANEPDNERRLNTEIARLNVRIEQNETRLRRYEQDAAAARNAEQEQLALQYEADARQILAIIGSATADLATTRQRLFALTPAPAPAPRQLPNDNSLVKFWRALQDDQVTERVFRLDPVTNQMVEVNGDPDQPLQPNETRFLTLPDGVFWLGNYLLGSVLMVRSCYYGLFDAITNPSANPAQKNGRIVTGNPGIGKTFFSAYFVYRLFQQHRPLTVVYEPAVKPTTDRYLLQTDGNVLLGTFDSFRDILQNRRPNVWYLVDGHAPGFYNAYTLLVTPLCRKIYKELEYTSYPMMSMPVWSWDELLACMRQLNLDLEQVQAAEERFHRWGGIARHVLNRAMTLETAERYLQQALQGRTVAAIRDAVGQIAGEQDVSHRILHIALTSGPESFLLHHTRLVFASDWVADQFLDRAYEAERENLINFLRASAAFGETAALRGHLLERFAHRLICQGGTFRIRNLSNAQAPESSLTIPQLTYVRFHKLDDVDLHLQNRYFRPSSGNHPAFDAIISPHTFLQMTVSQDHPVKAQRLSEAIQRMPADRVPQLYFVVPADIFETFRPQPYHTTDGHVFQNRQAIPANVQRVQQFALCISFTPRIPPTPAIR
ncbi:hypothetical protein CAOG_08004 [Capsaspora owczarzaki ATCC 30864]|uniref:Uncharacterized protein n=1 Tax=Capsaspora owczarzaki (strain ATCC 30864) TaxID=595528 RepID=A0A0D2WYE7_CAPO3|nr:hypothetical protein CAOG_08004 [Capsaspora owczarzaki ATCC 30864]KJE97938.1 hypothetical protein CAOG_008004 [Capsaspora owczarzaki ATCC 30864]|eukprot:XP_004342605.1 hypothetical protein CAOG_08004 [Capsaspora owczarzaki ATCC 30864]